MDRLGNCPICNKSWDAGEVTDILMGVDALIGRSQEELHVIATENYGWDSKNRKHMTDVKVHTIEDNTYLECPNCKQVFDEKTGQVYDNLNHAKYGEEPNTHTQFDNEEEPF